MARDYTIDVLSEALQLINEICDQEGPVSLAELTRVSGLTKNRAFRILQTLAHNRVIVRQEDMYAPGPCLGEWWAKYRRHLSNVRAWADENLKATEIEGVD